MRWSRLGENCYRAGVPTKPVSAIPQARQIAAGRGWSVSEFVCDAGPEHRPFEERHEKVTIAAVTSGAFKYRTHAGESLAHPGAFVLGAAGRCYECGHEHGRGDRCLSFSFDAEWFDEISQSAAGGRWKEFRNPVIPASAGLSALAARAEASVADGRLAVEELAVSLAHAVVGSDAGETPRRASVAMRDEKRIANAMRYIDEHSSEEIDLDLLAGVAGLSRFHFLRVFVRVAGMSPYRYLLALRMRRAAAAIVAGDERISAIAFEAGFGDLSTFNGRFRAVFGMTPGTWRRSAAKLT